MNNMFIRTKDGIYEIEDEITITPYLDEGWEKVFKIVDSNECIKEQDVIAQSDNLAELIDEFVYNNQILSEEDRYNEEYLSQLYCFNDIYGAIWTDKGLIYVAKMNEEGKLVIVC